MFNTSDSQIMRPTGHVAPVAPSAASVKGPEYKVQPLDDRNYHGFVMDMSALLRSKGILDFATTDLVERIRSRNLTEWNLRKELTGDQEALGIIQHHCTPTYKTMIKDCQTSKEAWDLLESHFREGGVDGHAVLMEEILELRFNWTYGMEHYLQEHSNLRARFSNSGSKQDDTFYISAILRGLPKEFDMMRKIIRNTPNMDLNGVIGKLRSEYKSIIIERKREETPENNNNQLPDQNNNRALMAMFQANLTRGANETLLLNLLDRTRYNQNNGNNRGRKRRPNCPFCEVQNPNHPQERCWANPNGSNYRPNWAPRNAGRNVNPRLDNANRNNAGRNNENAPAPVDALLARLLREAESRDNNAAAPVDALLARLLREAENGNQ
jgi:hypothetical protein